MKTNLENGNQVLNLDMSLEVKLKERHAVNHALCNGAQLRFCFNALFTFLTTKSNPSQQAMSEPPFDSTFKPIMLLYCSYHAYKKKKTHHLLIEKTKIIVQKFFDWKYFGDFLIFFQSRPVPGLYLKPCKSYSQSKTTTILST